MTLNSATFDLPLAQLEETYLGGTTARRNDT
jgi:hypothetical protein